MLLVVANTWNPIFFSPRRILGVFLTFPFYPLYRFQRRRGGSFGRIQFRPVKLLSLREEASANRFEGDQYRDWFQHVDSSLFPRILVYVVQSSPLWAISFEKIGDKGCSLANYFQFTVSNWRKNFFFPLVQFNFHITRTWFIYIFSRLIIFYGEIYGELYRIFVGFCNLFYYSLSFL